MPPSFAISLKSNVFNIPIKDRYVPRREITMKKLLLLKMFVLPLLFITLLLCGCSDNSLTVLLRFQNVYGLKQNDQVYFGKNDIGLVQKVTYTPQGDYLVEVKISPEFVNAATVDSKFYIEPFSDQSAMAVIVEQEKPGGTILNNGMTIEGSKRRGYFDTIFETFRQKADTAEIEMNKSLEELQKSLDAASTKLDSSLGAAINDLALQFNAFRDDIEQLPDSKEVQQMEKSIRQFTDEFQQAQKDVQDHIRDELLPQLHQELEHLREQLEKAGRKDELKEIDSEVKKLEMV